MKTLTLTLATMLLAVQPAAEPPEAADLVERYVEAIGGREAVLSQPGRWSTGILEVPAMGLEGEIEIQVAADRYRMRSVLPEIGEVALGYDGATGWMTHALLGSSILSGRMLDQVREQARLTSPLHEGPEIASMETRGRTEFEKREAWEVVIETVDGERYREYFDVETALLIGRARKVASPMGEVLTITILEDYALAGGILVPRTIRERTMGVDQVTRLTDVRTLTLAEEVFQPPLSIRVLLDADASSRTGGDSRGLDNLTRPGPAPAPGGRER